MPSSSDPPAPANGDAEIIRLIRERKTGGLRQLLETHGHRARAGLKRSLGEVLSGTEIDEAMNQATFRAWRSATTFDPDKGSLRAWFFVIARNAGLEIVRDRKRARWETRGDELEEIAANEAAPSPLPSAFLETLRHCIARLPNLQRKIIEADLRTGDVADAEELAKKLRTSKNSIYASRSMARKALKQSLLARGYVPGDGRSQELWN